MFLPLLHSPADIARWLMVAENQASDPTLSPLQPWPAYVAVEPDSPDEVYTLADTTGQTDGRDMAGGELNQHYGLQFRIRSIGEVNGRLQGESLRQWLSQGVYQALVAVAIKSPATYSVFCFSKIGQLLSIGTDTPSSKRWVHTLNCMMSVRRTA
jgi:hypothetical protein